MRAVLLRQAFDLPKPRIEAFDQDKRPVPADLEEFRVADDPKLRSKLIMTRIAEIIQSPGRGNWKKRPPTIIRVYPNFDAPLATSTRPIARAKMAPRSPVADLPSDAIVELREKWQAYYADTRAEVQRRHAERVHNVDPNAIATRARHMMAEARKNGKTLSSREAILRATDELTADYETMLRRKYGDLVVDTLGIPQFADVSDKKRLA
jgi:hypothetical protein